MTIFISYKYIPYYFSFLDATKACLLNFPAALKRLICCGATVCVVHKTHPLVYAYVPSLC